jgi:hypothetical protein
MIIGWNCQEIKNIVPLISHCLPLCDNKQNYFPTIYLLYTKRETLCISPPIVSRDRLLSASYDPPLIERSRRRQVTPTEGVESQHFFCPGAQAEKATHEAILHSRHRRRTRASGEARARSSSMDPCRRRGPRLPGQPPPGIPWPWLWDIWDFRPISSQNNDKLAGMGTGSSDLPRTMLRRARLMAVAPNRQTKAAMDGIFRGTGLWCCIGSPDML